MLHCLTNDSYIRFHLPIPSQLLAKTTQYSFLHIHNTLLISPTGSLRSSDRILSPLRPRLLSTSPSNTTLFFFICTHSLPIPPHCLPYLVLWHIQVYSYTPNSFSSSHTSAYTDTKVPLHVCTKQVIALSQIWYNSNWTFVSCGGMSTLILSPHTSSPSGPSLIWFLLPRQTFIITYKDQTQYSLSSYIRQAITASHLLFSTILNTTLGLHSLYNQVFVFSSHSFPKHRNAPYITLFISSCNSVHCKLTCTA